MYVVVNGEGEAKGTLAPYAFETYEIAPLLRAGPNVLAAEVRWFGENCPISEVHAPVPGFLVQGPEDAGLDTPGDWKCWASDAVTPDTTEYIENAHQFLNHLDCVDARREPFGWRNLEFDDSAWAEAISLGVAAATGATWGVAPLWTLEPRDVAAMDETPARFARVIEQRRVRTHPFGETPSGWSLAAGEGGSLLLDPGAYVTGFPEMLYCRHADRGAGQPAPCQRNAAAPTEHPVVPGHAASGRPA